MTPTQRTMRELRQRGLRCAVVERWNAFAQKPGDKGPPGIRMDLFGIVDVLALDPERGFIGVQCCSGSSASHRRKLLEDHAQESYDWLSTPGGCLEIWCWRQIKLKRGGKVKIWNPRIEVLTLESFHAYDREEKKI